MGLLVLWPRLPLLAGGLAATRRGRGTAGVHGQGDGRGRPQLSRRPSRWTATVAHRRTVRRDGGREADRGRRVVEAHAAGRGRRRSSTRRGTLPLPVAASLAVPAIATETLPLDGFGLSVRALIVGPGLSTVNVVDEQRAPVGQRRPGRGRRWCACRRQRVEHRRRDRGLTVGGSGENGPDIAVPEPCRRGCR